MEIMATKATKPKRTYNQLFILNKIPVFKEKYWDVFLRIDKLVK